MDEKAYKRCEYMIRQFMAVEDPSPGLTAKFHRWLLDGRHCREKSAIIEKLFCEALPDFDILPERDRRTETVTENRTEKRLPVHPT